MSWSISMYRNIFHHFLVKKQYRTKKELADYQPPQNPQFCPRPRFRETRVWSDGIAPDPKESSYGQTPMPTPSHHSILTPAWNPSSQTPGWEPRTPSPPPIMAPAPLPQHILLDPRLPKVRIQAKVDAPNMTFAKAYVYSKDVRGCPTICYSAKKTETHLQPNWVTVIHPNVKLHRGLLLVLEGEHIGKFGLRICHNIRDGQAMALLAFINRMNGLPPTLTGEEARFFDYQLAIVEESKKESKWNADCIQPRRKEAQR
jgi:hypothetical protein